MKLIEKYAFLIGDICKDQQTGKKKLQKLMMYYTMHRNDNNTTNSVSTVLQELVVSVDLVVPEASRWMISSRCSAMFSVDIVVDSEASGALAAADNDHNIEDLICV